MDSTFSALLLLTPFDIDKPKVRIGPPSDGGYIFVDDLMPEQALISYGISTEYRLELEFAQRGHDVFMFDHTIEGISGDHPRVRFFREGVAGRTQAASLLYSIEDHLQYHDIRGDRLVLKMDVEGAEFDAINSMPASVLARFEQIVLEVHSLDMLTDIHYRARFSQLFRKLNRDFTLFHAHANNFDVPNTFDVVDGFPVTKIIELSYIRTARVMRRPSQTLYPTSFDFPNTAQRDKLLWIFPFFPSRLHPEALALCADRVRTLDAMRS